MSTYYYNIEFYNFTFPESWHEKIKNDYISIVYSKNIKKKMNTMCMKIKVVKNWASDILYYIRTMCMYDVPIY